MVMTVYTENSSYIILVYALRASYMIPTTLYVVLKLSTGDIILGLL
jgi:hypothetical protein